MRIAWIAGLAAALVACETESAEETAEPAPMVETPAPEPAPAALSPTYAPELNVDRAWISTPWRRAYSTARM